MTVRNTEHLTWVLEHMPQESADALITFTKVNPHWRGAHWDDCLDTVIDADGHLDITEPMFDLMEGTNYPPNLVTAVTITLLWASQAFAEANEEDRATMVKATIANNGGPQTRIKAVLDLSLVVEPLIMGHLTALRMDTPEDEALRQGIIDTLTPWSEAVQAFRAWVQR